MAFWRSRRPQSPVRRPWLHLLADEVPPVVLESDRPPRVVWSPLWTTWPDSRIAFDYPPAAAERTCDGRRWSSPPASEDQQFRHMRQRIGTLINANLRYKYGQRLSDQESSHSRHSRDVLRGNSSRNTDKLVNRCRVARLAFTLPAGVSGRGAATPDSGVARPSDALRLAALVRRRIRSQRCGTESVAHHASRSTSALAAADDLVFVVLDPPVHTLATGTRSRP